MLSLELQKLIMMDIPLKLVKLIQAFEEDREFPVRLEDILSITKDVTAGETQQY